MKTTELSQQWQALLAEEPRLRIRDAAARLGVSEAELLVTRCGNGVTRLAGDWREFIKELPRLGRVMCLARNEHAVHERYGVYREVGFFGGAHGMGQVVGPDIDLRLFMSHWHHGFAVEETTPEGVRRSFQFFDADGTATHKVYLQPESNLDTYHELLEGYLSPDQEPTIAIVPPEPKPPVKPDAEINVEGFRAEWLTLRDTHQFFVIMRKYGVDREQALRLAPEGYAWQVPVSSTRRMLETASESDVPIMVFIGSAGCLQIHTGPVKNIRMFGEEWLNVLDPEFNMHLRDTAVARAWVVRKPTHEGGVVTSLELFDGEGENIALFFGARKPGELEDPRWAEIANGLDRL